MRSTIIISTYVLVLAGCATSTEIYTADGTQGFTIDCSGDLLTWGDCYAKAGELCGTKGYEILEKDSDASDSYVATKYSTTASTDLSRTFVIQCK